MTPDRSPSPDTKAAGLAGQSVVPPLTRQASESVAKTSAAQESGKDASTESAASSQKKVVYTVQAGAFRGKKDAETLKHKLEAKGYKVFVRKESNSKGTTLYKVRAGEFETKKEASLFALKLKKTDDLNAFAIEKK
jgi:cell division protein FtsN